MNNPEEPLLNPVRVIPDEDLRTLLQTSDDYRVRDLVRDFQRLRSKVAALLSIPYGDDKEPRLETPLMRRSRQDAEFARRKQDALISLMSELPPGAVLGSIPDLRAKEPKGFVEEDGSKPVRSIPRRPDPSKPTGRVEVYPGTGVPKTKQSDPIPGIPAFDKELLDTLSREDEKSDAFFFITAALHSPFNPAFNTRLYLRHARNTDDPDVRYRPDLVFTDELRYTTDPAEKSVLKYTTERACIEAIEHLKECGHINADAWHCFRVPLVKAVPPAGAHTEPFNQTHIGIDPAAPGKDATAVGFIAGLHPDSVAKPGSGFFTPVLHMRNMDGSLFNSFYLRRGDRDEASKTMLYPETRTPPGFHLVTDGSKAIRFRSLTDCYDWILNLTTYDLLDFGRWAPFKMPGDPSPR